MVGAAHALGREGSHAHVAQGLHPGFEDGAHVLVLLQPDAPVLARAVVLVEVDGEVLVVGPGAGRRVAEVPAHVFGGAEQPLLLAGPERHPDGAPRPRPDGVQDACGLEHYGHPRGVVARVRARVPGVEMGPQHDHLVGQVGAGDLAHDVARLGDRLAVAVAHLGLDGHRDAAPQDAVHAVVVLRRDRHHRNRGQGGVARPAVDAGSGAGEPAHRSRPAAVGFEHQGGTLLHVEGEPLGRGKEVEVRGAVGIKAGEVVVRSRCRRDHVLGERAHLLVGAARGAGREAAQVDGGGRGGEHGLAAQRAPERGQAGPGLHVGDDDVQLELAVRARSVGDRVGHQRLVGRDGHMYRYVLVVPADPVGHEGLARDVHQPDALHLPDHPALRAVHGLGIGQATAQHVGHVGEGVGELRALQALLADARDHRPVDREGVGGIGGGRVLGCQGRRDDQKGQQQSGPWHTRRRRGALRPARGCPALDRARASGCRQETGPAAHIPAGRTL